MENIGDTTLHNINYLYVLLLIIVGVIMGYLYFFSHKFVKIIFKPLNNKIFIKCIIGGLILGLFGTILPLTMFSGEDQIFTVMETGTSLGIVILIVTSIIKIILTNVCIESGLKGGHFFPMIFAGICMGYGFSLLLHMDPIIAMCVVTSTFLANIMKKPLAVVLLLMIIFPVNLIPLMLVSSMIACIFNEPKFLNDKLT